MKSLIFWECDWFTCEMVIVGSEQCSHSLRLLQPFHGISLLTPLLLPFVYNGLYHLLRGYPFFWNDQIILFIFLLDNPLVNIHIHSFTQQQQQHTCICTQWCMEYNSDNHWGDPSVITLEGLAAVINHPSLTTPHTPFDPQPLPTRTQYALMVTSGCWGTYTMDPIPGISDLGYWLPRMSTV